MQLYTFSQLVLNFTFYSILGWGVESARHSFKAGRFVNRGFFIGPFCPIYGFGAVLIQFIAMQFQNQLLVIIMVAFTISGLFEYLASWLLEKLFKVRWWEYRAERFQLHGRIKLSNTLLFSLLATLAMLLIQPQLDMLLGFISPALQRVAASLLIVTFVLDLFRSLDTVATLDDTSRRLLDFFNELHQDQVHHLWLNIDDIPGSLRELQNLALREPENDAWQSVLQRLEALCREAEEGIRLLILYPQLVQPNLGTTWDVFLDSWEDYRQRSASRRQERLKHWKERSLRTVREINPFTEEISFYKLVWVFTIASVLGYVLETVYCLVMNGYIESRQGMIYGPFNQLYGFGAVIMVLLLRPLANKSDRWLFFGGAILGGIFEYICSWMQELFFGTVSWEYSEQTFSFGGRTSLFYMFFWGILSVVYIKEIYPRISSLIKRIPQRPGTFFTSMLIIILSYNMAISAIAVSRWTNRLNGELPRNTFEEYLDFRYPDEMLREIYPNMQLVQRVFE